MADFALFETTDIAAELGLTYQAAVRCLRTLQSYRLVTSPSAGYWHATKTIGDATGIGKRVLDLLRTGKPAAVRVLPRKRA